jgi:hypothetical protein
MKLTRTLLIAIFLVAGSLFADPLPTIADKTQNMVPYEGYFNFYWEAETGKIWLEIDRFDTEFLYVNALSAGVGSNDIGLDRGQLGQDRVVYFQRIGPKVLLSQPNYRYRAVSDNPEERKSVAEAFASSVLGGFKVEAETEGAVLVDLTDFLLRDAHNVSGRLQSSRQGNYNLDPNRSAIYLERSKNFPFNSEFEALLTFQGKPTGAFVRSVVPSPDAITVRQHHSFIQLPDNNYQPRVYDPRSGYMYVSYQDYATPIKQSLVKRFIARHRLEKKNPRAAVSEAVEPIVYYLDRGAPEPIQSALIEGASWWNQAFAAAGYKDAFRVEVLPAGADPLDIRYNVIQWVHRSTRGWSYGSSVRDPRTGEIIKGHVSLGSLRVRQDFLIAQGLVGPYESGREPSPKMLEMALARLRQLSAHEVGHTLGLMHNYSSSVDGRTSVMDYPHPYIELKADGSLDFSKAYDTGIGEWDKRAILYGYQDFSERTNETEALNEILLENNELGLSYLTDQDARPLGSAHPDAHLWDNGANASQELSRILTLRQKALENFGEQMIPEGAPMATLEDVLVPVYFSHRYQVEAAAKAIGGKQYVYAMRGDGLAPVENIPVAQQEKALQGVLESLAPKHLAIPPHILELVPPRPPGYPRGREHFKIKTGFSLDPLAAAEASANHTLRLLLHPQRAARLVEQKALNQAQLSLSDLINALVDEAWKDDFYNEYEEEIQRVVQKAVVHHLIRLAADPASPGQVQAIVRQKLRWLQIRVALIEPRTNRNAGPEPVHRQYCYDLILQFFENPQWVEIPPAPKMPDGSPIGCGE